MKRHLITILFGILVSCSNPNPENSGIMQQRMDSLETKLAGIYQPDFGEYMIDIQTHHSKLWFAGKHKNWELANYEIQKINETINDLVKYQQHRKEISIMGMLARAVDSVGVAVHKKDPNKFHTTFDYMTKTCNICHMSYDYDFNVIKIPESSPFTNQEFKPTE